MFSGKNCVAGRTVPPSRPDCCPDPRTVPGHNMDCPLTAQSTAVHRCPPLHCTALRSPVKYFSLSPFSVPGDEIFSVNGRAVAGLTHSEAIGMFKETKLGSIQVTLGRREGRKPLGPAEE